MQQSYTKNYLKIYFFQVLSIILGFTSLFIVIPYLSLDKTTYGIYTICISITVFLSYADFGFLGAGMKYAAEYFAKNDRLSELKVIGFSHFILAFFLFFFIIGFLYLSFNPNYLIKELHNGREFDIAHQLLLILAVFSPTIILQRVLQTIYSIRLKDYLLQRIVIVGNLIKIVSVFYFFSETKYDIVNYFLFIQLVNLIAAIIAMIKAKFEFDYNFYTLLKYFRFDKEMFGRTKALAISGVFVTVSWILYYELDSFAIGKILGASDVAVFAIGFTMLSFFRSLLGVFFAPFSARFNHFLATNNENDLRSFYIHILIISLPLVVFPILAVVFFAKAIVLSWVGSQYLASIPVVQFLILCNLLAFISYPAGMLLNAQEKIKMIYLVSFCMPIFYWGGIYLTIDRLGVLSFALFKSLVFLFSGIVYLWYSLKYLKISLIVFFKKVILPYLPSLSFLVISLYCFNSLIIGDKNKYYLFLNAIVIGVIILLSMLINLFFVKELKAYSIKIIHNFKKR